MKIYGNKLLDGQEISRAAQAAKNVEKTDTKTKSISDVTQVQGDKVDISSKGKEVSDLMSVINQMPGVREDKIKAIQGALESGTYTINPSKIAEKMLKEI